MSRRIVTPITAAVLFAILLTSAAASKGSSPGQQPPVNLTSPTINGTPEVGGSLSASTGTWNGKGLKYAYQWLRCNSTGVSCAALNGATTSSYSPVANDVGYTFRAVVTASNRVGSAAATSDATAAVPTPTEAAPPPPPPSASPSVTSLPTISGTAQEGQTLTGSSGTWSGTTPITYTYQWQRCDTSGGACAPISGAIGLTYLIGVSDVSSTLRISVTATNSTGSTTASSAATALVTTSSSCINPSDPSIARLFSCSSAFNTPIPANPPIHPNSANFVRGLTDVATIAGAGSVGDPLRYTISSMPQQAYPPAGTPTVRVHLNYPTCNKAVYDVPIPSGTVVENQYESALAVHLSDGTSWDLAWVTSPGTTPIDIGGGACPATGDWNAEAVIHYSATDGGWEGNGYGEYSARASHTAYAAGTVLIRDMAKPAGSDFGHAFAMSYGGTSNGSIWPRAVPPAGGGDGTCYGGRLNCNEAIPQGARFQLDPSVNCDSWTSLASGPEWKRMVCRTLERYGIIVTNTTGYPSIGALTIQYQSTQPQRAGTQLFNGLNGFSWSDYRLPADLKAHMRVIDWNQWTG